MTASQGAQIPKEYLLPAAVGLAVVLITAAVLFYFRSAKFVKRSGRRGTKYVIDEDGTHIVRRSTRSSKKPTRFEPILHGPGGTPLAEKTNATEKATPKSGRTPKAAVKEEVKEETPAVKKVATRPRKTPAAKEAASPPTSPMRTRRALRSPK